ncbi:MAG: hypothetical protein WAM39_08680 [Bryobacteraceae bacterium]
MTHQLFISDPELELILELLERDQKELLVEIRHTDSHKFREELRARRATIESLIERGRTAQGVAQTL